MQPTWWAFGCRVVMYILYTRPRAASPQQVLPRRRVCTWPRCKFNRRLRARLRAHLHAHRDLPAIERAASSSGSSRSLAILQAPRRFRPSYHSSRHSFTCTVPEIPLRLGAFTCYCRGSTTPASAQRFAAEAQRWGTRTTAFARAPTEVLRERAGRTERRGMYRERRAEEYTRAVPMCVCVRRAYERLYTLARGLRDIGCRHSPRGESPLF